MIEKPKLTIVDNQASAPIEAPTVSADQFDLARFRLPQDFAAVAGIKKVPKTFSVRKPDPQKWIRVHPDPAMRYQTAVLELKEERQWYLVAPVMIPLLEAEVVFVVLFVAITRAGDLFVWPVKLPREGGRGNEWSRSALEAAEIAMTKWVRVVANMGLGAYETRSADSLIEEPPFPTVELADVLKVAFKDRIIETPDHPVARMLLGGS
jgi:hypothetical protein